MTLLSCLDGIWLPVGAERHELANGTVLLARRPQRAPQAWLHHFFPPLSDEHRATLRDLVPNLPEGVERLLLEHGNGVSLFDGGLNIYGLRTNNVRSLDAVLGQPFSIQQKGLPSGTPQDACVIGSYSRTGHRIVMEASGEITVTQREKYDVIWRSPSLSELIVSEVERLSILFAANDQPTKEEVLPWTWHQH